MRLSVDVEVLFSVTRGSHQLQRITGFYPGRQRGLIHSADSVTH